MDFPYFPFKISQNGEKEIAVHLPYIGNEIHINASAATLLRLCNGSRFLEEIIGELRKPYHHCCLVDEREGNDLVSLSVYTEWEG